MSNRSWGITLLAKGDGKGIAISVACTVGEGGRKQRGVRSSQIWLAVAFHRFVVRAYPSSSENRRRSTVVEGSSGRDRREKFKREEERERERERLRKSERKI
ncbi:hypothetical protein ALC57_14776 [Trachymyrmex cornetzi]|uniref:Uncharacterized protein n=1 Tax=Trachymyrmex cornetzi TaxID=471704 RepID=A0A195DJN2_9HYME|nr:hypothetical protein ALC57_14776 [Trachymyrmex cornetzi]